MLKVPYGQDPYSVIRKYIQNHISVIEDIIAVIEIDDIVTNQLFMVDMNKENYFIWYDDWYEGEKDVALIHFFPVSVATNPSAQPEPRWIPVSERLPEEEQDVLICNEKGDIAISSGSKSTEVDDFIWYTSGWRFGKVIAWMPLPEPYKEVKE